MILDDYVTMTGCDYDTSCILPACTEKSDECNELYDCSTLSTAEDSVTTSCDIIVSES